MILEIKGKYKKQRLNFHLIYKINSHFVCKYLSIIVKMIPKGQTVFSLTTWIFVIKWYQIPDFFTSHIAVQIKIKRVEITAIFK